MESLEQFIAKQHTDLEKKKAEIAEFEALGPIPGLTPWLIHGKLYDVRHIAFKLVDLGQFLAWARENADKIHAVEGTYKIFYPHIPNTRDYQDAAIKATGEIKVEYSTIMRRFCANVFVNGFRISFDLPAQYIKELIPIANYSNYRMVDGARRVESWGKTNAGVRQYLRQAVDKQSADLETLLTFEQFESFFLPTEVTA